MRSGPAARLGRFDGEERFDVLPLLVATDGAIAALGVDGRRLRPNIVVGGVDGLGEREWPGRRLQIGEVVIAVAQLRARCVMTTYDPDTQAQDPGVLRRIVREFGGTMALDCAVVAGGAGPRGGSGGAAVERPPARGSVRVRSGCVSFRWAVQFLGAVLPARPHML